MTYKEIIYLCVKKFNETFDTSYNIQYDSKDNILNSNPNFKVSEKTAGLYDKKSHEIYIFSNIIDQIRLKNYKNSQGNNDNGLTFLIRSIFHELEHRLQDEHPEKLKNQFWYAKSMYAIESIILGMRQFDPQIIDIDYARSHDNFLLEIDADIKGINNAKSFVTHNNIKRNKFRLL